MRQFVYSAAFWLVLVVAIRLAVCFPESLLARVLFSHHGPVADRTEGEPAFRFRRARFFAGFALQCALLLALGALARDRMPSLSESLYLDVLQDAVIPVLACLSAAAALVESARALWLRHRGSTQARATRRIGAPQRGRRRTT